MKCAYREGCASALGAGSMFVFHGPNDGLLINYHIFYLLKLF
jgi:hypothetical protein